MQECSDMIYYLEILQLHALKHAQSSINSLLTHDLGGSGTLCLVSDKTFNFNNKVLSYDCLKLKGRIRDAESF